MVAQGDLLDDAKPDSKTTRPLGRGVESIVALKDSLSLFLWNLRPLILDIEPPLFLDNQLNGSARIGEDS